MLYRCVLVADWLRRETVGEWCVCAGERARGTRGRGRVNLHLLPGVHRFVDSILILIRPDHEMSGLRCLKWSFVDFCILVRSTCGLSNE